MARSTVKVQLDRAHLEARLKRGKEHCGRFLAEQIWGDSIPFTPHDQGTLQSTKTFEQKGNDWAIVYNEVYSAYQWYGCWPDGSHVIKNHDLSHNKQATTQWIEAAKQQFRQSWETVAQREFVKGAGG